jgi:hypothetical protein
MPGVDVFYSLYMAHDNRVVLVCIGICVLWGIAGYRNCNQQAAFRPAVVICGKQKGSDGLPVHHAFFVHSGGYMVF